MAKELCRQFLAETEEITGTGKKAAAEALSKACANAGRRGGSPRLRDLIRKLQETINTALACNRTALETMSLILPENSGSPPWSLNQYNAAAACPGVLLEAHHRRPAQAAAYLLETVHRQKTPTQRYPSSVAELASMTHLPDEAENRESPESGNSAGITREALRETGATNACQALTTAILRHPETHAAVAEAARVNPAALRHWKAIIASAAAGHPQEAPPPSGPRGLLRKDPA